MRWWVLVAVVGVGCESSGGDVTDGSSAVDAAVDAVVDGWMPPADAAVDNPLLPRVENTTCRLPSAPPLGAMELVEAFPSVDVERPIWIGPAPGGRHLYLATQGGQIRVLDPENPRETEEFLDISVSRAGNEEGLLGLAFHPRYAENGRFYLYYSAANPRRSVVSELRRGNDPFRADRATERILMEVPQPFSNHNGGDLRFGPDGFLYISLGDGGSGGDPQNHGQRPETVLGSILRIDVDHADAECGTPYGIPADNPFAVGRCGADQPLRGQPEVYAWGLRNVWRMAFDAATGELWAADVGQDAWEEIDIIVRGGNYGWREVEGERCFSRGCDPSLFLPPVFAYGHDQGKSITGGFVYRGADLPELFGAYVFGDYASGRIWALRRQTGAPPEVTLLTDTDHAIASFGEDAQGEIHVLLFTTARSIARLRRRDNAPNPDPVPATLSATGCYADTATRKVAAGVIPFQPVSPFWSDGVEKTRFFALPAGGAMTWRAEDAFEMPVGTVLIKDFTVPGEAAPFETRLLVREADQWSGYSYRWRADGTDADLLPGKLETTVGQQTWLYPSRAECETCHVREAGGALGLSSRQLNAPIDYGTGRVHQLEALVGAGYVRGLPAPPRSCLRWWTRPMRRPTWRQGPAPGCTPTAPTATDPRGAWMPTSTCAPRSRWKPRRSAARHPATPIPRIPRRRSSLQEIPKAACFFGELQRGAAGRCRPWPAMWWIRPGATCCERGLRPGPATDLQAKNAATRSHTQKPARHPVPQAARRRVVVATERVGGPPRPPSFNASRPTATAPNTAMTNEI